MLRAIDEALAEAVDFVADDIDEAARKVREKGFVTAVSEEMSESLGGAMEVMSGELNQVAKNVNQKGVLQTISDDLSGMTSNLFGSVPQRRRRPKQERTSLKDDMDSCEDFNSSRRELAEAAAEAEAAARAAMKAVASPEKPSIPRGQQTVAASKPKAQQQAPPIDLMNQPLSPTMQLPDVQLEFQAPAAGNVNHDMLSPTCSWPAPAKATGGAEPFDPNRPISTAPGPIFTAPLRQASAPAPIQQVGMTRGGVGSRLNAPRPPVLRDDDLFNEDFGPHCAAPGPPSSRLSPTLLTSSQRPQATPTGGLKLFDLMTKDAKQLGQCITTADLLGDGAGQPRTTPKAPAAKTADEPLLSDAFAECRW